MRGLSPVAGSVGHSSSRCAGLSLSRPLLLRSTGSRRAGSAIVAHGPSRSVACGIFPDQGSNPCALHWQADSQPLCHQGSPLYSLWGSFYCSDQNFVQLFVTEEARHESTQSYSVPNTLAVCSPFPSFGFFIPHFQENFHKDGHIVRNISN